MISEAFDGKSLPVISWPPLSKSPHYSVDCGLNPCYEIPPKNYNFNSKYKIL